MNKVTSRQVLIPFATIAIICFIWFGPFRTEIQNIIVAIITIIANYIEYKGKPFSALGFQREKFTTKNILVQAPLVALGLFAFYYFALVPGITALTGVSLDYSSFDELKGNLPAALITLYWCGVLLGLEKKSSFAAISCASL